MSAAATANARMTMRSTEDFGGDRLEPAIRVACLQGARRSRRIERACAARSLDVDELPVRRAIDAGDRDAVVGRDETVAGVDQLWLGGPQTPREVPHRRGAELGPGI